MREWMGLNGIPAPLREGGLQDTATGVPSCHLLQQ
jgi:hypothetical protein